MTAAGQVLRQEGSEGPHDVVEGRQAPVQEHTALHQGQAHGQAGQPARATGRPASGREATVRQRPGSPHGPEKPSEGGSGQADAENSVSRPGRLVVGV